MVLDTEKGITREDNPSSVVGTEMLSLGLFKTTIDVNLCDFYSYMGTKNYFGLLVGVCIMTVDKITAKRPHL